MGISKQTLVKANVFIQRCLSLGMSGELQDFLASLSEDSSEALQEVLSIVRELNKPSALKGKIQKAREQRGVVPLSDVDLVIKHLDSFKATVQTYVNSNGLSATAGKIGMNPANLAALLKDNHKPRFETVRRIAIALGITQFEIRKSKSLRRS